MVYVEESNGEVKEVIAKQVNGRLEVSVDYFTVLKDGKQFSHSVKVGDYDDWQVYEIVERACKSWEIESSKLYWWFNPDLWP